MHPRHHLGQAEQDEVLPWNGTGIAAMRSVPDTPEQNNRSKRIPKRDKKWLETQYTSLVQQVTDFAIFTLDTEGRPTSWNKGVQQVLHYSEEEFLHDLDLNELFTSEDIEAGIPQRELELALKHGSSLNDRWMMRKGGTQFFATGTTTRLNNENGEHIGFAKLLRDNTDQRLVEERSRESEEHLRMALAAAEMGTWSYRVEDDQIVLDENLIKMLRLPVSNSPWNLEQLARVVHPDDRPWLAAEVRRMISEGREIRSEFRMALPDMETRWLKIQGRSVQTNTTGARLIAGACLDITARRRSEIALKEADHRKDEFLATLAHELRNPLAPLRNGLRVLELADDDPAMRRDTHKMMDRQVDHMVHLIDDLLDVSRISRGTIELRKERVELRSVIERAVETSQPSIQKAGHHLNVLLPPDPIFVEADVTRLTQVFNNLLNNASKYTEPGGDLSISMRLEGGEVMVVVSDDGVGIPPELLDKVFEIFAQVDRFLERSRAGLGIGLSLVKRLVSMHGGRVEAFSEGLGRGSKFMVFLPILEISRSTVPDQLPDEKGSQRISSIYHRIMVVDDNLDATETMANIFKVLGHQVRTAKDGAEAVTIAEEFRPELIFMDIGTPRMNGYEACAQIRKQRWGKQMVIVALTGWGQDEDRKRSEEAGFDRHLVKPVDGQTVARLIGELEKNDTAAVGER